MAEAIQQKLKSTLGVDVKLANMEWNTFLEEQKALKFQFSQSSFLADYADPINFLESFQTGNAMNRTGWSNSEYDELIKAAKMKLMKKSAQSCCIRLKNCCLKGCRSYRSTSTIKSIWKRRM